MFTCMCKMYICMHACMQASAMGYHSVKVFLRAEKKQTEAAHAAARVQAAKEAMARKKVSTGHFKHYLKSPKRNITATSVLKPCGNLYAAFHPPFSYVIGLKRVPCKPVNGFTC